MARAWTDFKGRIVHPQTWPEDLDYAGKQVVVIGSGATAATLIPAIADDCAHVTMLQRSPTYFRTGRNAIEIADELRQLQVDEAWIHEIVRRKILLRAGRLHPALRSTEPEAVKQELLGAVRAPISAPTTTSSTHFTPRYRPWRQRIAFVPDGDLFKAHRRGQGLGRHRRDRALHRDGHPAEVRQAARGRHHRHRHRLQPQRARRHRLRRSTASRSIFADTVTYRGMMFTGVPNMAWVFGYFRASWTLRADLVADFVCRLLNHMKAKRRAAGSTWRCGPRTSDMPLLPWIDPENFNPGYMMRGMHLLPKRGDKPEWQHTQDYWAEKDEFPAIDLDDPAFVYG